MLEFQDEARNIDEIEIQFASLTDFRDTQEVNTD